MRAWLVRLVVGAWLFAMGTVGSAAQANPWAGVPLDELSKVGIGAPTLDERADRWRAPLPNGGWVEVRWYPEPALAAADFEQLVAFGAARPAARLSPTRAGDELGGLELKDNLIIRFSAPDAQGWAWVERLSALVVAQVPAQPWQTRGEGPAAQAWDLAGRRIAP